MCVEMMYSWCTGRGGSLASQTFARFTYEGLARETRRGGELEESEKEASKLISESGIRRERTTLIKEIAWYTCTRPYNTRTCSQKLTNSDTNVAALLDTRYRTSRERLFIDFPFQFQFLAIRIPRYRALVRKSCYSDFEVP